MRNPESFSEWHAPRNDDRSTRQEMTLRQKDDAEKKEETCKLFFKHSLAGGIRTANDFEQMTGRKASNFMRARVDST